MNTLLMFVRWISDLARSLARPWQAVELSYQEVVDAIEQITGDRFEVLGEHPSDCPEVSFYDFTGELLTVFLISETRISLAQDDVWLGDFSPNQALHEIWAYMRGR